MKKAGFIIILLLVVIVGCSSEKTPGSRTGIQPKAGSQSFTTAQEEKIALSDLANWQFLGIGMVSIDRSENALCLAESDSSKGVTLVSPKVYGTNVVVSCKVKPVTYESVNVVIISASDKDTGGDIRIPSDYDGNFGFWNQGSVQNYVFAFHNAAHDSKPFIMRNPGMVPLAEAETHVTRERWHDIELGRHGSHVFMKIDGNMIIEAMDTASPQLPGGKICFRMRGTPGHNASALFKDVIISEHR